MFRRNRWSHAATVSLFVSATVLPWPPSSALASSLQISVINMMDWAESSTPLTFTVGTSPTATLTANFTQVGQTLDFPPSAFPAFTTAITNGIDDTLTFSVNAESFTRPESFFATSSNAAPTHTEQYPFWNGIDWKDLRIDFYEVWLAHSGGGTFNGGHTIVEFSVWGGAPEPSSIVLVTVAGIVLSAARFARPRG